MTRLARQLLIVVALAGSFAAGVVGCGDETTADDSSCCDMPFMRGSDGFFGRPADLAQNDGAFDHD